ncbi:MAG: site-2 protease family protein [bacterium]
MGIINLLNNPILMIFFIGALLIAISVHEFMHAWTANYLGDPTAKYARRVTLNPIAHLDPIGTLMIFLVGFGWGKPVPINPNNFQNPRLGSALTSLAGPMSNLLMAIALALLLKIPIVNGTLFAQFLLITIQLNLVLMLFNLIPIPPLDGSKVLALVFPEIENPKLQIYGIFILLALLFFGGSIFSTVVSFLMKLLIGV